MQIPINKLKLIQILINQLKLIQILLNKLKSLLDRQDTRLASFIQTPTGQGSVIKVVYSNHIMWVIKPMGMSNV